MGMPREQDLVTALASETRRTDPLSGFKTMTVRVPAVAPLHLSGSSANTAFCTSQMKTISETVGLTKMPSATMIM